MRSIDRFKACHDTHCVSSYCILDFDLFWRLISLPFVGEILRWLDGWWIAIGCCSLCIWNCQRHVRIFYILTLYKMTQYVLKWEIFPSLILIFSVRGRLGSILPLVSSSSWSLVILINHWRRFQARNSGILIAYIAGALITYKCRPYFFILVPIIYLIWVYFLPNTPQFYLKKNQFQVSHFHLQRDQKHDTKRFKLISFIINLERRKIAHFL